MKGFHIENGRLELDIPEILREMNVPDTEENRDLAVQYLEKIAFESGLLTPHAKVEHNHLHRCAGCRSDWKHGGKKTSCVLPKYSLCANCKN